MSLRVICFSLCSFPYKVINGSQTEIPNWRMVTASAEDSALSLPPPNTQQKGHFTAHSSCSGSRASLCIHTSLSLSLFSTAIIRPFPKTFTSSFPVQNPKIIVRSYLKPFTAQRAAGTNKTLLGEPSLAVYKQDTKSSVTLPWEAQGLLNMPGALHGQARGS